MEAIRKSKLWEALQDKKTPQIYIYIYIQKQYKNSQNYRDEKSLKRQETCKPVTIYIYIYWFKQNEKIKGKKEGI